MGLSSVFRRGLHRTFPSLKAETASKRRTFSTAAACDQPSDPRAIRFCGRASKGNSHEALPHRTAFGSAVATSGQVALSRPTYFSDFRSLFAGVHVFPTLSKLHLPYISRKRMNFCTAAHARRSDQISTALPCFELPIWRTSARSTVGFRSREHTFPSAAFSPAKTRRLWRRDSHRAIFLAERARAALASLGVPPKKKKPKYNETSRATR